MRSSKRMALSSPIVAVLIGVALGGRPAAGQAPVIARASAFGPAALSEVRLSPDGRWVAFLRPTGGELHLWVGQRGVPLELATRLTRTADLPVRDVAWTPDSRRVLYHRDAPDGRTNLLAVAVGDSGSSRAVDLTPVPAAQARLLRVPDSLPSRVVVELGRVGMGGGDVYVIDVVTGRRTLIAQNPGDVVDWLIDRSGHPRVAVRATVDGGRELLEVRNDTLTVVKVCAPGDGCHPLRLHPDGRRVYLADGAGGERTALALLDLLTGEMTTVHRDPTDRTDLHDVLFAPYSDRALATTFVRDTLRRYVHDEEFDRLTTPIRERFGDAALTFVSANEDEMLWVIRTVRPGTPDTYYTFNLWADATDSIGVARPEVVGPAPSTVVVSLGSGASLPARLTLPATGPDPMPGLVLADHDGWEGTTSMAVVRFWVSRGYAVIQPGYRGPNGAVPSYVPPAARSWASPERSRDIGAVARWLGGHAAVDAERVGVIGVGVEAFPVFAAAAEDPNVFAAVATVGAATDIRDLADAWESSRWPTVGGIPAASLDEPTDRRRAPASRAAAITAPVLLVHRAADRTVPVRQSRRMASALRDAERPVRYVELIGPSAGIPDEVRIAAELEAFLAEHLGGGVEPGATGMVAGDRDRTADQEVDPRRIAEERLRYRVVSGDGLETELVRTFDRRRVDGVQYLRIIDATEAPVYDGTAWDTTTFDVEEEDLVVGVEETPPEPDAMIPAADTIDLLFATLRPVRRRADGAVFVDITYAPDRITGEVTAFGFTDDVDVALDAPVYADGAALDAVLAALPLEEGYGTSLRVFDAQWQSVVTYALLVDRTETLRTAGGTFETLRVQLVPVDNRAADARTLHVFSTGAHHVVRAEIRQVDETGAGDTQVLELVERSR